MNLWDQFKQGCSNAWDGAKRAVKAVVNTVKAITPKPIKDFVKASMDIAKAGVKFVQTKVIEPIKKTKIYQSVSGSIKQNYEKVKKIYNTAKRTVIAAARPYTHPKEYAQERKISEKFKGAEKTRDYVRIINAGALKGVTPKQLTQSLTPEQLAVITPKMITHYTPAQRAEYLKLRNQVFGIENSKLDTMRQLYGTAEKVFEAEEKKWHTIAVVTEPVKEAAKFIPGAGRIITVADAGAQILVKTVINQEKLDGWDMAGLAVNFIPVAGKAKGAEGTLTALKTLSGARGLLQTGWKGFTSYKSVAGLGFFKGGLSVAGQSFMKLGQVAVMADLTGQTVTMGPTVKNIYTGKADEEQSAHYYNTVETGKQPGGAPSGAVAPTQMTTISHTQNGGMPYINAGYTTDSRGVPVYTMQSRDARVNGYSQQPDLGRQSYMTTPARGLTDLNAPPAAAGPSAQRVEYYQGLMNKPEVAGIKSGNIQSTQIERVDGKLVITVPDSMSAKYESGLHQAVLDRAIKHMTENPQMAGAAAMQQAHQEMKLAGQEAHNNYAFPA